jgi:putative oxidoreductase
MNRLNRTDLSFLILRMTLGSVMLAHGLQKAFGLFGGYGFHGTMNYFTDYVGMPYFLGVLVILAESFGMALLIIGLAVRWIAASVFIIMTGALFAEHLPNGFFMNWFGNQNGEGIEFDLLIFSISIALVLCGSGAYSVDHVLKKITTNRLRFLNVITA